MSSNFPNGFMNGVTIRGLPIQQTHPGEVFWVNNSGVLPKKGINGSNVNNGSYLKPFSTINHALDQCTANRGDIIMVMPGHSEDVDTDGGIALDVAGVAIIGLGIGTKRPKLVIDTSTDAAVTITAANVTLANFQVVASLDAIKNAFDITATNATLQDIEFSEEAADMCFIDTINCSGADNTADGLHLERCVATSIDDSQDSFLLVANDLDRLVMKDCIVSFQHANALHLIEGASGADFTDCFVDNNRYATLDAAGAVVIVTDTTTANTGFVTNNHVSSRDTAGELMCTAGTNITFSQNYSSSVIDGSGYLLPAADS